MGRGNISLLGPLVFGNTVRFSEVTGFRYGPGFHIQPTMTRFGELPLDSTLANCLLTDLGDLPEAAGKAGEDYVFAAPADIFTTNPGTGDYRLRPGGIAGKMDVGYRPGRPPVCRPIADKIASGFGY